MKTCPMCGNPLNSSSLENSFHCLKEATYDNFISLSHYREDFSYTNQIIMLVPPYRLRTTSNKVTHIDKNENGFFKTIFICPTVIHPDTEDKLRERIKIILLFS